MLRKLKNWCSHFQGPKKCVLYLLSWLMKEDTGENFGFPVPCPELPALEICALLLLEKSEMHLVFKLVCMNLSIDRK